MPKGMDLYNKLEETKDGCDKNCKDCIAYLNQSEMCMHEYLKYMDEYSKQRHIEFQKYMEEFK